MRASKLFLTTSIGLARSTLGQNNDHAYRANIGGRSAADPYNYDLFVSASQQTNITRVVPIGDTSVLWRVNVSSVSVPDAESPDNGAGPAFQDPQVVQTVYDLQFPGGVSLESYLNSTGNGSLRNVCASVFLPPMRAIRNNYREIDNGDCGHVLGDDCVAAYLRTAFPQDASQCPSFDTSVPECTKAFENVAQGGAYTFSVSNKSANKTSTDGTPWNKTESGTGFFFAQSNAVNGSNTTTLDMEKNRLQVMVLSNLVPGQNQLVCQRVTSDEANGVGRVGASWMSSIVVVGVTAMAMLI